MTKYTYLLVNFFTIIVPFIFSFHPKLKFHKTWRAFFPAVIVTAVFFLAWDEYFTRLGVWGFNDRYLIGIYFGHLPLEELLFFFCIPYACVYTYHCLDIFIKREFSVKVESILTNVFIAVFLVVSALLYEQTYTLFAFLTSALLLILAKHVLKVTWLTKFYIIYGVLLFPFLIVNGVLTGTGLDEPVVWYNENEFIGFRILTIPFEDVFYGMSMILLNMLIYKKLLVKGK
ncbi:MAG: lycopene cyclase domain-containing protein [Pedobacter sp.]|nr:MAG: lycopene cyclase domain-containing protein [Pedobacter sp.]